MSAAKVRAPLLVAALVGALAFAGSSAMAWIPFESPAGGPYWGKLDPAATASVNSVPIAHWHDAIFT